MSRLGLPAGALAMALPAGGQLIFERCFSWFPPPCAFFGRPVCGLLRDQLLKRFLRLLLAAMASRRPSVCLSRRLWCLTVDPCAIPTCRSPAGLVCGRCRQSIGWPSVQQPLSLQPPKQCLAGWQRPVDAPAQCWLCSIQAFRPVASMGSGPVALASGSCVVASSKLAHAVPA